MHAPQTGARRQDKWLFFYFISPSLYYQFGHFSIFIAFANMKKKLLHEFRDFSAWESLEKLHAFLITFSRPRKRKNFHFIAATNKRRANENIAKLFFSHTQLLARVKLISILHMPFITATIETRVCFAFIFSLLLFLLSYFYLQTYAEGKVFAVKKSFHLPG